MSMPTEENHIHLNMLLTNPLGGLVIVKRTLAIFVCNPYEA